MSQSFTSLNCVLIFNTFKHSNKRAEQVLPGSKGGGGEREGGRGQGVEMAPTAYAHMSKGKKEKTFKQNRIERISTDYPAVSHQE
jgi:hypothetical protein